MSSRKESASNKTTKAKKNVPAKPKRSSTNSKSPKKKTAPKKKRPTLTERIDRLREVVLMNSSESKINSSEIILLDQFSQNIASNVLSLKEEVSKIKKMINSSNEQQTKNFDLKIRKTEKMVYFCFGLMSVLFVVLVSAVFSGCTADNYAMCSDFVKQTNETISSCPGPGSDEIISMEKSCPEDLRNEDIDCSKFYECLKGSVQCTEDGIQFNNVGCPPCKTKASRG